MADNIGNKAAHDYHLDVPVAQEGFYVKGNTHCDWGMKNRLSRMFDPKSGNTVILPEALPGDDVIAHAQPLLCQRCGKWLRPLGIVPEWHRPSTQKPAYPPCHWRPWGRK